MQTIGDIYEITCDPAAYEQLKQTLQEKEIPTQLAEISMVPQNTIAIENAETARKIIALMDELEDHEDVQNTYANFDISDEIISQVS
jgi:transcriptional/translational regulatory protein YebC/TACO1